MRRVDQIAVQDYGFSILQMMENAGRNLASAAVDMIGREPSTTCILAGAGGNGGGGLSCARHLLNRGYDVEIYLTRPADSLSGPVMSQWYTLQKMGNNPVEQEDLSKTIEKSTLIIDALIGYGLSGPPNDPVAASIESANHSRAPILSLDIPSGMNATTGETPGAVINPIRTLTLALPKSGLSNPVAGELILGDIGIPKEVFEEIGIQIPSLFEHGYRVPLERV